MSHLRGFLERDLVVVTHDASREHPGVVLQPRRSGGDYGSPESLTVPAFLGLGRYTFDVTAHLLELGELGIRRARRDEQTAIRDRLEEARLEMLVRHAIRAQDENRSFSHDGCVWARVNRSHTSPRAARASGSGAGAETVEVLPCQSPAWPM